MANIIPENTVIKEVGIKAILAERYRFQVMRIKKVMIEIVTAPVEV